MRTNIFKNSAMAFATTAFIAMSFTSCSLLEEDDEENVVINLSDIPSDKSATPNPTIENGNTVIPNFQCTVLYENKQMIVRLDMTGVQDPNTLDWMHLYGTGSDKQNVWVSVDNHAKGFTITNTADQDNNKVSNVDLVFLIDNSGSMGQESDTLAADVVDWAKKLSKSSMNIRFGCVGYDGRITGGMDMSTADSLSLFLNREGRRGKNRSVGFYGANGDMLNDNTSLYNGSKDVECGVAALRFADDHFTFRPMANRIYVNLTDEPNCNMGYEEFSVNYINRNDVWPTTKGTIHTVYSADTTYVGDKYYERPWLLSQYTGGTIMTAPSDFRGVSLDKLPVTGAIQNSYIIRFANIEELLDGNYHDVKITILSPDSSVRAERTISVKF